MFNFFDQVKRQGTTKLELKSTGSTNVPNFGKGMLKVSYHVCLMLNPKARVGEHLTLHPFRHGVTKKLMVRSFNGK
jgi:hypothetical protein